MFFNPCDHVINGNGTFLHIFFVNQWLGATHIATFFETSVLKKVRILCPLSPQQYYKNANTKCSTSTL